MNIYDRSVHTEDFLAYHLSLIKERLKLDNSDILEEKKNNAKLLQDFLNTVAGFKPNEKNPIDTLVYEQIDNFISNANIDSFRNNAIVKGKKVSGIEFEKWLTQIVNQTFKEAGNSSNKYVSLKSGNQITNQSIRVDLFEKGAGAKVLGKEQINFTKNLTEVVDEEAKELLSKVYRNARQEIAYKDGEIDFEKSKNAFTNFENGAESIGSYWRPSVGGKIDVATNFSEIIINIEESTILGKILRLLQNTTFSLKGYSSDNTVRIGQTNPYRTFLAVTESASAKEKSYRWARMLNCISRFPEHESALIFYKLRYIYELTGYGAQYSKNIINQIIGDSNGAEYIVYYREGQGIRVLSSAVIYNNFLRLIEADELQVHNKAEINNKDYALYSIMKLRFKNGSGNNMTFELE